MAKPLTDNIEHVVVLMLENRSFDNVLGGLYPQLTQQGRYRGLRGNETNPRNPANPAAGSVTVFQGPAAESIFIAPYPDPGELYSDMVQQIFGSNASVLPSGVLPPMSGFAWNYTQQPPAPSGPGFPSEPAVAVDIMQYYSPRTMPVSTCLGQGFAVCDSWFAAAPVQTLSNRVLTHCGTPSCLPSTNGSLRRSRINNPDYTDKLTVPFVPPVTDTTIFELLDARYPQGKALKCSDDPFPPRVHLNWKVYYHDAPLSALCRYVYDRWCFDTISGGNVFDYNDLLTGETRFEQDVRAGLLPKYSFIEPRYSDFFGGTVNSNHPGGAGLDLSDPNGASLPPPVSVQDGERLLWDVYSTLLRHPQTFVKTLLIVTYDEHGGLFDHVPPPPAVSPFKQPVVNFDYDRYGVRVPTLLISPWIRAGTVYPPRQPGAPLPSPPFDHTSILSTLIAQFDLPGTLTPRVVSAPKLEGLIASSTFPFPRCSPPPAPAGPAPEIRVPTEPVTELPTEAHNLAGALAPLYETIRRSKRGPGGAYLRQAGDEPKP